MKFSEIVKQAVTLLQESQRITYRALKLEFDLTDEQLEALKDELLFAHPEIADEAGRGLVWSGGEGSGEPKTSPQPLTPNTQHPPWSTERSKTRS